MWPARWAALLLSEPAQADESLLSRMTPKVLSETMPISTTENICVAAGAGARPKMAELQGRAGEAAVR